MGRVLCETGNNQFLEADPSHSGGLAEVQVRSWRTAYKGLISIAFIPRILFIPVAAGPAMLWVGAPGTCARRPIRALALLEQG